MQNNRLQSSSKAIGIWLLIGVGMIIIQFLLGGITRLTGSGLSITEWRPILGILPPINEQEWQKVFNKYQEIAQFKHLNAHFTLSDFKFIFFWEWFHRLWGMFIGLVFSIPFLVFLVKGSFKKDMITPLLILFLLGGLQGFIGWIMVKSGLNDQDLYVSHFRLAIHFMAALVLLVYTFWFALKLLVPNGSGLSNNYLKNFALIIIALLIVQLTYGAFMSGLKAGIYAPTWPDINGAMIPAEILGGGDETLISTWINHPLAIHFIHRNLAYLLTALVIIWTVQAAKIKTSRYFNAGKWWPLALVFIQVVLGIWATLTSYRAILQGWGVFEWTAQLHQLVAIFFVLSLTWVIYSLKGKKHNS